MSPSETEIRQSLAKILETAPFRRARRSRELLSNLVDAALNDRASSLKGFTIAVDVFGRDQAFDADNDSLDLLELRARAIMRPLRDAASITVDRLTVARMPKN